jgi:hypothetical protein
MKNFINQFTDLEIESIEEMSDYGNIEAWMFVKEPNQKLSYIDYTEEDLF